jgi:phosphotransferase system HPr (HPr) family protein
MKDFNVSEMPPFEPIEDGEYWRQRLQILNKHGLHARPSARIFEKILQPHGAALELHFDIDDGDTIAIKSIFDLMSLGLEQGTQLTARIKYHNSEELEGQKAEHKIAKDLHDLFIEFCED